MSQLAQLSELLQQAGAEISQSERALAEHPGNSAIQLTLASLQKHEADLEDQFARLSSRVGVDVCRYRLFGKGIEVATNVFGALIEFQKLLTTTYSALKHGPKERIRVGEDDRLATAFGFSHVFPGSVGVAFTLTNERLLLGETKIDEAMDAVFTMAKLTDSSAIRHYASQFGVAVVRELYRWSQAHSAHEMGAAIDWRRTKTVRASVLVQPQELLVLEKAIHQTSDARTEKITQRGTLVGADVQSKRFHFKPLEGEDIRGMFADAISESHVVELPSEYVATVLKSTVLSYSTNEETVTYFLESLSPLISDAS